MISRTFTTSAVKNKRSPWSAAASNPPIRRPTVEYQAIDVAKSVDDGSWWLRLIGIAVRKCQANTKGLVMAAISVTLRDTRFLERRHLGKNLDRRLHEAHPEAGSSPFA